MQQTNKEIAVRKPSYIKQIPRIKEYLEEAEFLKNARADAERLKIPIVDDETGRFLELTSYLSKPSKILEIGCGTGYSTYFLLKYLLPQLALGELSNGKSCDGKSACLFDPTGTDKSVGSAGNMGSGLSDSLSVGIGGDKLNYLAGNMGATLKSIGGVVNSVNPAREKVYESAKKEVNNSKKKFSYTGIDLNRKRLDQACLYIGSLINKTIIPCHDGKRIKTFIECERFCFSFEFIHGNAIKILREEPETQEKYDLVFIDAAKYQYPHYLEAVRNKIGVGCAVIADNIFYNGKIFKEETLKHDANSVAGLTEYLRIINKQGTFETSLFNIGDGIAFSLYKKDK